MFPAKGRHVGGMSPYRFWGTAASISPTVRFRDASEPALPAAAAAVEVAIRSYAAILLVAKMWIGETELLRKYSK